MKNKVHRSKSALTFLHTKFDFSKFVNYKNNPINTVIIIKNINNIPKNCIVVLVFHLFLFPIFYSFLINCFLYYKYTTFFQKNQKNCNFFNKKSSFF